MKSALLIGAWAVSTVGGFWWYDGRYRLPVVPRKAERPSVSKTLAFPGAKATLLAFYSPDCGCSRFALSHIRRLDRDYRARGLRVTVVIEGGDKGPDGLATLRDPDGKLAKQLGVPAAPGAVVIDGEGKIVYTGGFNVARFCDDERTAFAKKAIDAVLEARKPVQAKGAFYGCRTAG